MLNYEQQVELAKRLKCWEVDANELSFVDLSKNGLPYTYAFESLRGGRQVIIGNDGKLLFFSSSLSLDKVLNEIKNNNVWEKAVDPDNFL